MRVGYQDECFPLPLKALIVSLSLLLAPLPAAGQILTGAPRDATPEEVVEREGRKACKAKICAALHNRKAGEDISCDIVKSWRKESLDKVVGKAGVSWPWGKVVCKSPVKLKRDMLIKTLAGPKYEADIGAQSVHCTVDSKDGKEPPADIRAEFSPKVTFEGGKATRSVLHWGKVDAPTLIKGAMWTATATDNTFNVLQSIVTDDINVFASTGCDEVKAGWSGQ